MRLNGAKAGAAGDLALTVAFTDTGERFAVSVENAVLHHVAGEGGPLVSLTRPGLIALVIGETTLEKAQADGGFGRRRGSAWSSCRCSTGSISGSRLSRRDGRAM